MQSIFIKKFKLSTETYREMDIMNMSQDTQHFRDDSIDVSPNDLNDLSLLDGDCCENGEGKTNPMEELLSHLKETTSPLESQLEESEEQTDEVMDKFEEYKKLREDRLKQLENMNEKLASLAYMNPKDRKKAIQSMNK